MIDLAVAFLLIIALFISLSGWGKLLVHLVSANNNLQALVYPLVGIAVITALGGWLNLLGLVTKSSICVLMLAGVALFAIQQEWKDFRPGRISPYILPGLFMIPVLILPFLDYPLKFHPYDDFQSYLVLPVKMLQSGSLGFNPFMDRQMENSLGGDLFLQSMVLSFTDVRYSYILDISLGVILSAGLIISLSNRVLTKYKGIPLLMFLLIFPPKVNSTYVLLPVALILGLLTVLNSLTSVKPGWQGRFILAGLIAAAIVTTKTLYSAFTGFLILIYLFLQMLKSRNRVFWIKGLLLLAGAFLFVLLPWMIYSRNNFGTYFYPFLGKGHHISAQIKDFHYVNYSPKFLLSVIIIVLAKSAGIFFVGFILFTRHIRSNYFSGTILSAMLASALISVALTILISGGDYFHRYTYPFLVATSVILLMVLLEYAVGKGSKTVAILGLLSLLFSCSLSEKANLHLKDIRNFFALNPPKFINLLTREIDPSISILNEPLKQKQGFLYEDLIGSVPDSAGILVYLKHPYKLDLSSDRLFIMDTPYALQPFGRMPENDPDSLAGYFQKGGLEYLAAYRVGDFNAEKAARIIRNYNSLNSHRWNSTMIMYEARFRKLIMQIAENYQVIYDDGVNYLIDLARKKASDKENIAGKPTED